MNRRKPRVMVYYQDRGQWTVHVEGLNGIDVWCSIIVTRCATRKEANDCARPIRRALYMATAV